MTRSGWSRWLPRDPENICESAYIHFVVCKILGIIPFSQVKTSAGLRYRLSHIGNVYAAAVLVLNVTFFQLAVDVMSQVTPKSFNSMSNITAWGQVYAIFLAMIIAIFTCWFNQTGIISMMHRFVEIDDKLGELNAKPSYKRHYRTNAVHLCGLLLLVVTSVMSNCAILNPNGVKVRLDSLCFWFICFFPITINILTLFIFGYMMRFTKRRLMIINKLILEATPLTGLKLTESGDVMLQEMGNKSELAIPVNDHVKFIRQLAVMHGALCEVARHVNGIFGFHLLVNIAISFGVITIQLYYAFVMMIGNLEMDLPMLFNILAWVGVQFCTIFFCIVVSATTETQAKRTGVLLHMWNTSTSEKLLHNTIEMFSMQILHNNVHITACGFFRLRFELFTSIMGAVTTYLVIIIQFHLSSDVSPPNSTVV